MSNITVAQAKTMFLESIEHQRSANTVQTYRKALETFINMISSQQVDSVDFPVAELREEFVGNFVEYMKDLSPATENLYLQIIKGFFEFLAAEKLAVVNLSRVRMLIRQRSRRARRNTVEYPEEDIKHIVDVMSNKESYSALGNGDGSKDSKLRLMRDRALIIVLADTGLRVEEICSLRRGDLDWETRRVILKGQGGKRAVVRFSTRAINSIHDYLTLRDPIDLKSGQTAPSLPLFARHDKGAGKKIKRITPTTIRRIIAERVSQIAGPEVTPSIAPHTFLHFFVTTILRATGNLKLAQVLARHSSIQTTQRYAHINDDELDKGYYEIFEKKE